jgi:hypothetical protein
MFEEMKNTIDEIEHILPDALTEISEDLWKKSLQINDSRYF